jgi:hypothetical protein
MKIEIEIADNVAELLATLADGEAHFYAQHSAGLRRAADRSLAQSLDEKVRTVLLRLADHAQQGVYRPGAWERQWITQVFGDGFEKLLETFNDVGHQRPRRGG